LRSVAVGCRSSVWIWKKYVRLGVRLERVTLWSVVGLSDLDSATMEREGPKKIREGTGEAV